MTQVEINRFRAMASLGLIPDEENPIFLFNMTHKEILMDIVSGKIDAVTFACMELQNRGLDETTGVWVGWNKKEKKHQAA